MLWHDGISGRSAADLASAYWRFFYFVDSAVDLIVWADNCTAQQKNYLFFTTLIQAVNHFRFKKITIKFLKRGHTAMKSDSVHAGIEREVRKRSNVYDFESFIDVVEQANSGFNKVLVMKVEHFKDFANGMRQRKPEDGHPPIAHFVKVEARKGSRSIFYALDHEDEIFVEMDLLREGISLIPPSSHISQKGVSQGRKHDILKNCCPLMPEEYRKFWNELSISEPEKTSQ